MRTLVCRILHTLHRAALGLVAAGLGLAQAATAPSGDAWDARGDAAFHPGVNTSLLVNAFAQDRQGFLWLGSQGGLMRWDGYKLRTFLGDVSVAGALPDSFVQSLQVDSGGRLWVGTGAGGIARYDEANERFEIPVPASALSGSSVYGIAEDRDGTLLLGTGGGLDRLDPVRRSVQRHADWAATLGLPQIAVRAVVVDRGGNVWAGTDRGLYKRGRSGRFVQVPLGRLPPGDIVVQRLLEDGDGRIWAGTSAHGVFTVEPGMMRAQPLHERLANPLPRMSATLVLGAIEARPGEVWLGTIGQGIYRIDTRQWQVRQARHIENVAASLPKDDVTALFRDRQGLVWASTGAGVSFHDAQQTGVTTWFGGQAGTGGLNGGLTSTNVPFVLPMPDGTVWVSVGEGGIDIVSPAGGRVRGLRPDPASPQGALPEARVICMAMSPSGREVYAGTRRGLYRIAVDDLRVERLELPGRPPTASIWALAWQGDRLWVGGADGLWGLEAGQGRSLRVVAREKRPGPGDPRVTALLPGRDGGLWIGTQSGLLRMDPVTMRIQPLPQDAPGRLGVPAGYIVSIAEDARGRIWVAGYGAGIRTFEPSPEGVKNLRRVSTAEGLPTNAVNTLAIDLQGDAWASTDEGLARIAHDTLQVEPVGPAEGLGVLVYWAGSAGVTPSGHVLFGGTSGLTIVDPRRGIGARAQPPRVVVTEVRLGDGRPLTAYQAGPGAPLLELGAGRRSLLVEFAGLHFAAPSDVHYQYRLSGTDPQWISTDANRRFAAYTHLPPGDHVLELRAAAPKGPWSEPVRLPLRVHPAWHETAWARGAAVLAAGAVLLMMLQARTAVLRRRERVLQALVAERTRQLEESQRQLEQIAYFDGLTGLANRRAFNDELDRMVAACRRSGRCGALVLVDLDHFKQINDMLGHDAGDAMLVAVAQRLTAAVRETDRVARLGGDEFAILLPEVEGAAAVQAVCERVFAALAQPVVHRGSVLQPGASAGAALCPVDAQAPDELYKAADIALYAAKREGRNGWRMASTPRRYATNAVALTRET
jgi:diguanylate cyclase (GGDEF)-like protein